MKVVITEYCKLPAPMLGQAQANSTDLRAETMCDCDSPTPDCARKCNRCWAIIKSDVNTFKTCKRRL